MKKNLKLTTRKISLSIIVLAWMIIHQSCNSGNTAPVSMIKASTADLLYTETAAAPTTADAATIISRQQVPILCYHQIRDFRPADGPVGKNYIVPVSRFAEEMTMLADNGYHTILPDQLYDYLVYGKTLPSNPVMITFDDTRLDQYTTALPELNKHGFKGVFFIMTVSLGRPGYMSKEEVKQLSDEGHVIGSHTWDHHSVKQYTGEDWTIQIDKPSKQLKEITGKPIEYFAYPFGLWNKEAIANLKHHGFKSVFQLSDRRDENDPLYSIRRIIVPGEWSAAGMMRVMRSAFK
jgi:peptidoglycan/xylan/chitin deacetylase (PgdA/CDA1 family)